MTNFLRRVLWPAIAMLIAMTVLTGAAYPALITVVAQGRLPAPGERLDARGRRQNDRLEPDRPVLRPAEVFLGPSVGRRCDGHQPVRVRRERLGGLQPGSHEPAADRPHRRDVDQLRAANGDAPVPVDLVTTSASGFDPDISPAAADYQVNRVAAARGLTPDALRGDRRRHTEQPLLGFLGQARVHVLELNLDLDGLLQ